MPLSLSKYLLVAPGFMDMAQFQPIVFTGPKAPTGPPPQGAPQTQIDLITVPGFQCWLMRLVFFYVFLVHIFNEQE